MAKCLLAAAASCTALCPRPSSSIYAFEGYWLQQSDAEMVRDEVQGAAVGLAMGPGTTLWEALGGGIQQSILRSFGANGTRGAAWRATADYGGSLASAGPVDLAVDLPSGTLFVLDATSVQAYSANRSLLTQWDIPGPPPSDDVNIVSPYVPTGIAVDPSTGNVVVGCYAAYGYGSLGQLFKFSPDGSLMCHWGGGKVAVDGAGYIYVVDRDGSGILKYSSSGAKLLRMNQGSGGLRGIAVHSQLGRLFATNSATSEVQVFATSNKLLGTLGKAGNGAEPEIGMPTTIAVDEATGKVYVADAATYYVLRFNNGPVPPCTDSGTNCELCETPTACAQCKDMAAYEVGPSGRCQHVP
ncbi:hypothetical protein ABPG75_004313 [Micractinium tetrahymenae]